MTMLRFEKLTTEQNLGYVSIGFIRGYNDEQAEYLLYPRRVMQINNCNYIYFNSISFTLIVSTCN